jgi:hypothetical protein
MLPCHSETATVSKASWADSSLLNQNLVSLSLTKGVTHFVYKLSSGEMGISGWFVWEEEFFFFFFFFLAIVDNGQVGSAGKQCGVYSKS